MYYFTLSTVILIFNLIDLTISRTASIGAINGIKDNLKLAGIVPNTLPLFQPKGILTIQFFSTTNSESASIGRNLLQSTVKNVPSFSFTPSRGNLMSSSDKLLLVMMDVDASILHFVSTNLTPSTQSFKNGSFSLTSPALSTTPTASSQSSTSSISYLPPNPPSSSASHRYLLLLYLQPPNFISSSLTTTTSRTKFNLSNFTKSNNLGTPLSATFFRVSAGGDQKSTSTSGGSTGEMIGQGSGGLTNPIDDSGTSSTSSIKKSGSSKNGISMMKNVGYILLSAVVIVEFL